MSDESAYVRQGDGWMCWERVTPSAWAGHYPGPLAQRWLDNDAPVVTGLPPTTRRPAPMAVDFVAFNEGMQNLAAWAEQVVEQLVRAFQPSSTREGGV